MWQNYTTLLRKDQEIDTEPVYRYSKRNMIRFIATFSLLSFILLPGFVYAQEANPLWAGTAEYLRQELGYSAEQLSTPVNTEEREAFQSKVGEGEVVDPLGDVLDRTGKEAQIQFPSADLQSAVLKKNELAQTWDITFTVGGIIPIRPSQPTQFLAYFDRDGDRTNNEFQGIGVGMDAVFIIQWTEEDEEWQTRFRWYNPPAEFWARDMETDVSFEISGNEVVFQIPFEEVPGDIELVWRAVAAVSEGRTITQVDAAPTVGFPPAIGETLPKAPNFDQKWYENPFLWLVAGLSVAALVLLGVILKRRRRRLHRLGTNE